ncbi:MAG TPA: metallophosphoesterase [Pirellulaceae bacterium]|nr:metallophosphoesterase [Pirellulaceae bacterium]
MPRVAWLTDIHLNFVRERAAVQQFLGEVASGEPDLVLIGGDIAPARDLLKYLKFIDQVLRRPIYFVLGNHDYYFGSIEKVRKAVKQLCQERPNLHYLSSEREAVQLGHRVGLVGHDGWADGRAGDFDASDVMLNDYLVITDLTNLTKEERKAQLEKRGDEAVKHIRGVLPSALRRFEHVLLLTHVPPYPEACFHKGTLLNGKWLPHYCCLALGEAIVEAARRRPKHRVTVLAGHLHAEGQYNPEPNVSVLVGGAEYGNPAVARVFHLPD